MQKDTLPIKFLGTGGAFDIEYGNSAALVTLQDKNILIDCGSIIYSLLCKKNLIDKIDYILLTHFHDDHIGSLSGLILHSNILIKKRIKIIYPGQNFYKYLMDYLNLTIGTYDPKTLADFISIENFTEISAIDTTGKHAGKMPSFSYYFIMGKKIIAYSGDLGDPDIIFEHLRPKAPDYNITVFHEIYFDGPSQFHSYYKELEKYQTIGEVYGYHCNAHNRPKDLKVPLVYDHKEFLL